MNFLNANNMAFLLALIPLVIIHILIQRRAPKTVSSLFIWKQITPHNLTSKRIEIPLSFIITVLVLILLALGASSAYIVPKKPQTYVFLDISKSMNTTDVNGKTRLSAARNFISTLPSNTNIYTYSTLAPPITNVLQNSTPKTYVLTDKVAQKNDLWNIDVSWNTFGKEKSNNCGIVSVDTKLEIDNTTTLQIQTQHANEIAQEISLSIKTDNNTSVFKKIVLPHSVSTTKITIPKGAKRIEASIQNDNLLDDNKIILIPSKLTTSTVAFSNIQNSNNMKSIINAIGMTCVSLTNSPTIVMSENITGDSSASNIIFSAQGKNKKLRTILSTSKPTLSIIANVGFIDTKQNDIILLESNGCPIAVKRENKIITSLSANSAKLESQDSFVLLINRWVARILNVDEKISWSVKEGLLNSFETMNNGITSQKIIISKNTQTKSNHISDTNDITYILLLLTMLLLLYRWIKL